MDDADSILNNLVRFFTSADADTESLTREWIMLLIDEIASKFSRFNSLRKRIVQGI
jgi:hypothetical protein